VHRLLHPLRSADWNSYTEYCTKEAAECGEGMNNTRFVLLIRRSRNYWTTGQMDVPLPLLWKHPRALPCATEAIRRWEHTFSIRYIDFRNLQRNMAINRISQSKFDQIILWSDRQAVESLPRGTWLIPFDEDDWISFDLITKLRTICDTLHENTVAWTVLTKHVNGQVLPSRGAWTESCGYAVRLPTDWKMIMDHCKLKSGPRIPDILACYNKNPASLSYLERTTAQQFMEDIREGAASEPAPLLPKEFHDTFKHYVNSLKYLLSSLRTTVDPACVDGIVNNTITP
jgi:hypothetical protein